MKKSLVITLVACFIAQSAYACFVFFTNDLDMPVMIKDRNNPSTTLELSPGAVNVQWAGSDAHTMADFTATVEETGENPSKTVVAKQIKCTPDKNVYLNTSDIMQGKLIERVTGSEEYFVVNPTEEDTTATPCGCSGKTEAVE